MTLKALVLVGGYGTRLRPLTFTVPKPLVEFANKPILFHQLDALRDVSFFFFFFLRFGFVDVAQQVGVKEVILAVSYRPESLVAAIAKQYTSAEFVVKISVEEEPLGTAGPLGLARDLLLNNADGSATEAVFVLNSDVACEFHFEKLLNFHRESGAEGTIMTTPVEDPSKYGVVVSNKEGLIERFVEKPATFVGNMINAGLYLLSPAFLARIKPVPTSIERDVFPVVAAERKLYALELPGFWMDVGQPRDYLKGNHLFLKALSSEHPEQLAHERSHADVHIRGRVLIHATAKIAAGCDIGPDVVIGAGCVVGPGVRLERCTLLQGVHVQKYALVRDAIVGWHSRIGAWARVVKFSVLGEDVAVGAEVNLTGTTICPHKSINADCADGTIII